MFLSPDDEVLRSVARAVTTGVKKDDYVFRWGGEEILVILKTEKEIAKVVAEEADAKLYCGKRNGKNQVVSEL